jgi:hypothetical protein
VEGDLHGGPGDGAQEQREEHHLLEHRLGENGGEVLPREGEAELVRNRRRLML